MLYPECELCPLPVLSVPPANGDPVGTVGGLAIRGEAAALVMLGLVIVSGTWPSSAPSDEGTGLGEGAPAMSNR